MAKLKVNDGANITIIEDEFGQPLEVLVDGVPLKNLYEVTVKHLASDNPEVRLAFRVATVKHVTKTEEAKAEPAVDSSHFPPGIRDSIDAAKTAGGYVGLPRDLEAKINAAMAKGKTVGYESMFGGRLADPYFPEFQRKNLIDVARSIYGERAKIEVLDTETAAPGIVITLNGRPTPISEKTISYFQIVERAGVKPDRNPTVAYMHGPDGFRNGTLIKGGFVPIQDGMVFSCAVTDKA